MDTPIEGSFHLLYTPISLIPPPVQGETVVITSVEASYSTIRGINTPNLTVEVFAAPVRGLGARREALYHHDVDGMQAKSNSSHESLLEDGWTLATLVDCIEPVILTNSTWGEFDSSFPGHRHQLLSDAMERIRRQYSFDAHELLVLQGTHEEQHHEIRYLALNLAFHTISTGRWRLAQAFADVGLAHLGNGDELADLAFKIFRDAIEESEKDLDLKRNYGVPHRFDLPLV